MAVTTAAAGITPNGVATIAGTMTGTITGAGVTLPVVLPTIVPQQVNGRAKLFAFAPPSVKPVKVIGLATPTAAVSKVAVAPGPATSVTPAGVPFNEVKVAAVVPSNALFAPSGKTSMRALIGPPVPVKLGVKSVGVRYVVGL